MFLSGLTFKSKAQCVPDNCSLVFTNMIDCYVELEITYNCPPSIVNRIQHVTLLPGTRSSPSIMTLGNAWDSTFCGCTTASISKISVFKIGNYVFIPTTTLLTTDTFIYTDGTCCSVDLGYYNGCDVSLWMSCP